MSTPHRSSVVDDPSAPRATAGPRLVFLDLLRVLATVQMVQGHTIDALLADDLRTGSAYAAWTWLRGLTAPAFLCAAGLAYHAVTLRRIQAHLRTPGAIAHRVRRAALLVALGYLMHLPFASLWTPGTAHDVLRRATVVDILQCVGVLLFLLEMLVVGLRSRRAVIGCAALGFVGVIALTPFAHAVDPRGTFMSALQYLSPRGGSLFPLLPWASYLFFGVLLGEALTQAGSPLRGGVALAVAGVVACSLSNLHAVPAAAATVCVRLGALSLVTAALVVAQTRIERLPRLLERIAGGTLTIYMVHVVLLYADGAGLAATVGHTLPWSASIACAVVMLVACAASVLAVSRLVGRNRR